MKIFNKKSLIYLFGSITVFLITITFTVQLSNLIIPLLSSTEGIITSIDINLRSLNIVYYSGFCLSILLFLSSVKTIINNKLVNQNWVINKLILLVETIVIFFSVVFTIQSFTGKDINVSAEHIGVLIAIIIVIIRDAFTGKQKNNDKSQLDF